MYDASARRATVVSPQNHYYWRNVCRPRYIVVVSHREFHQAGDSKFREKES